VVRDSHHDQQAGEQPGEPKDRQNANSLDWLRAFATAISATAEIVSMMSTKRIQV
jgi:hypothetical protein